MRPRAIDYTGLIGRDVDMERPHLPCDHPDDPLTIGMRCRVIGVRDTDRGVEVLSDEGMAFLITEADESFWRFDVRQAPAVEVSR